MTRNQCAQRLRRLARVRRDEAAFEHGLLRGWCANRKCKSRFGIVRITYDFRDPRSVIKNAELVCAACDRVWSSKQHVPNLSDWKNVQRHRITMYLPPDKRVRIWVNRGHIYREGDDAVIVNDANYGLLMDAYREWHKRNDRHEATKARAQARKREAEEAAAKAFREFMAAHEATWDQRDAERRSA